MSRRILVRKNTEITVKKKQRFTQRGYYADEKGRALHREIYKAVHGSIPLSWVIHHIDCNKFNNDIENLIALPEKVHNRIHQVMAKFGTRLDRKLVLEYLEQWEQRKRNEARKRKLKERGEEKV